MIVTNQFRQRNNPDSKKHDISKLSLREQWKRADDKKALAWLQFDGNKWDAGNNEEGC